MLFAERLLCILWPTTACKDIIAAKSSFVVAVGVKSAATCAPAAG